MPEQQRLAGSNFSYFCFPLNDFLEVQKRLGFETIELFGGSPQLWIDAYEHEDGKKIQKKIKEAGLVCPVLTPETAAFQYPLWTENEEWRAYSISYWKQAIAVAAEMGCRIVCVTVTGGFLDQDVEKQLENCCECLKVLVKEAHLHGIRLALEAAPLKYGELVKDLKTVGWMIRNVPGLYAALDTAVMIQAKETVDDWVQALGDRIIHVHLADSCDGAYQVWGEGSLDPKEIVEKLEKAGYKGIYSLKLDEYDYYDEPAFFDERNRNGLLEGLGR